MDSTVELVVIVMVVILLEMTDLVVINLFELHFDVFVVLIKGSCGCTLFKYVCTLCSTSKVEFEYAFEIGSNVIG